MWKATPTLFWNVMVANIEMMWDFYRKNYVGFLSSLIRFQLQIKIK
jgi:hypothetical protein